MAASQNGYSTIQSTDLDDSLIPGTDIAPIAGLREGDVATVLLHVGKLFNERVAKLYAPGCWGWAPPIPIPGSTIISNHGSGTAIDLNAPSFPWKLRKMTNEQRQACRGIVNELEGVVAWGGDFTTYVDEMHFEVIASEEDVARVAKKLKEGNMKPTRDEWQEIHQLAFQGDSASDEVLDFLMNMPDLGAGLRWLHSGGTWVARTDEVKKLRSGEAGKALAKIKELLS